MPLVPLLAILGLLGGWGFSSSMGELTRIFLLGDGSRASPRVDRAPRPRPRCHEEGYVEDHQAGCGRGQVWPGQGRQEARRGRPRRGPLAQHEVRKRSPGRCLARPAPRPPRPQTHALPSGVKDPHLGYPATELNWTDTALAFVVYDAFIFPFTTAASREPRPCPSPSQLQRRRPPRPLDLERRRRRRRRRRRQPRPRPRPV